MLQFVLQWLDSVCIWSKAVPSNNVFQLFAASNMYYTLLHWELSNSEGVVLVGFVPVPALTGLQRIAISGDFVMALCVVGGECHSVYLDRVMDSIFMNCDGVRRFPRYLNGQKVFDSNFVSNVLAMRADSLNFAGSLYTKSFFPSRIASCVRQVYLSFVWSIL